jgi:hypothetical protein
MPPPSQPPAGPLPRGRWEAEADRVFESMLADSPLEAFAGALG